jgi:alginate O-acetyltransferase complex protein AlgI
LAKKVFIANILGEQADLIFDTDYEILTSMEAWIGILAYTFQIYFDFSGYSDMAIGLGRMMGFPFPENFNSPYISKSITEFWRRWHITLSEWMRDYLYISLGGNKVNSKFRLYSNLITVFVISGLWHGASWNFILWGSLHGIFLIMDRLFLKSFLDKLGPIFSIPITFFLAMMGWVVFRIEEFDHALDFYSILFSFEGGFLSLSREVLFTFLLAFIASFMTIIPFVNRYKNKFVNQRKIHNWRSFLLLIIALIALFLSIIKVSSSDFNPFIYFRF